MRPLPIDPAHAGSIAVIPRRGTALPFIYDDGGRAAAGFHGIAGDCVARSIAIASGRPYREVCQALAAGTGSQRAGKAGKRPASARNGISTSRKWFKDFMAHLGFHWVSTMGIGTECRVHLRAGELPPGRLVVRVSRHYTAVIDGVVRDNHDPQRGGERCVYGYWMLGGGCDLPQAQVPSKRGARPRLGA